MLNSYSGNAMITKAMAMYGRRLTEDDYTELLRKRSVGEIASYLKSTPGYEDVLKAFNESSVHRGRLEMLLHSDMFSKYERLSRYDTASNGGFFKYAVRLGETQEILRLIRYLNSNDPEGFIADIPAFLTAHASFDLMSLAEVKNFAELIDVLSTTPYAAVLNAQNILSGGKIDYTTCEVALRAFVYFSEIKFINTTYRGKTRIELLELVKSDIEVQNICTIFRARVFFNKSQEEINAILFPIWNRLRTQIKDQLVESANQDEFLRLLSSTYYGKYIEKENPDDIDRFVRRVKFLTDKQIMRFSSNAPSVLYAFVSLCKIELYNITSIIEGVRYGVSATDIQKLLITY